MPRRRCAIKRETKPDPICQDILIGKVINRIMKSGKKTVAQKIVYGALNHAVDKLNNKVKDVRYIRKVNLLQIKEDKKKLEQALEILKKAIENIQPTVELRPRRVGGLTLQIPVEVDHERGEALAIRWLLEAARQRGEQGMVLQLAGEIVDAHQQRGAAIKKRDTTHSMAKANQAFAHLKTAA